MKLFLLFSCAIFTAKLTTAQVQYVPGPALENDRNAKMNRLIEGDEKSFYTYRIKTKGRGTSFYVEKYDKNKLQPTFSKEISLDDEDIKTSIENVLYAQNNIYVFRSQYDKHDDKMTLFFQTVSSSGEVSTKLIPITVVESKYKEFVDFEIYLNPSKTKFMVKASHKASNKEEKDETNFILLDATKGMNTVWTKTVNRRLVNKEVSVGNAYWGSFSFNSGDAGFTGLYFDDKDNVYYCYTDNTKNSTEKERRYQLFMATLNAEDKEPKTVELKFDDDYLVKDIEFLKNNDNEVVVGGYVKDVIERRGRDLVKVGLFSYKINLATNTVAAKAIYFLDDKMLKALESSAKRSRYFKYKLDYILPIGDAVYYVGEQYREEYVSRRSSTGSLYGKWEYEYMDVIVAKLNSTGQFEWIKNVPLRNEMDLEFAHVFKQYIAVSTDKSLYILCDDHPKNMARYEKDDYEPSDLKSVKEIHGSNFVSNEVDLAGGSIKRSVVFENADYCFAPIQERDRHFMPPPEWEIFVPGKKNEIYVYTEDRGRDQFAKLLFK